MATSLASPTLLPGALPQAWRRPSRPVSS